METIKTTEVLKELKTLVHSPGYIYTLCLIINEDFRIVLEEIQDVDFRSRLNKNEVSLLIGFLVQNDISFATPNDPLLLIEYKNRTYELMKELHRSLLIPFFNRMEIFSNRTVNDDSFETNMKSFYNDSEMFIEPIFYSNDGVYDFQYSDFIDKKYALDKEWLTTNRKFDFNETKIILNQIKKCQETKYEKVNFFSLKEKLPEIIQQLKKESPLGKWEENLKEILPAFEFYQYVNLFFKDPPNIEEFNFDKINEEGWSCFYKNLIELFVVRKEDFRNELNIDSFLQNFSFKINQNNFNKEFSQIGDFNMYTAQPILQLDDERFFVPITFSLFEACYESPYYWMLKDETYKDILAKNRGDSGEIITYEFLSKIFGKDRTYKSVKVVTKKGTDDTDIDVLCVLGSKALVVQIKSKKLTSLARKGSYNQLQVDFKGAVQDAFEQGVVCRTKILSHSSKFFDENGNLIKLSEKINEVYIMGVTSENYPALTHQAHTLLTKKDDSPYPLFLTLFDLELVAFYLSDPYDFLYYVRQRISLMNYFKADNEMIFVGFHLTNKLWKLPDQDFAVLDSDIGKMIDRNYYPHRLGVEILDDKDLIKNRWRSESFSLLCNQLGELNEPKITDIIFALLDWDADTRDDLMKYIKQLTQQTKVDNEWHNVAMMTDHEFSSENSGITFVSSPNESLSELLDRMIILCELRKYKSKADRWIGLGSLKGSSRIIDLVIYNDNKWQYDKVLEEDSSNFLKKPKPKKGVPQLKKLKRNDICLCGTGLKFKKCCGKK